MKTIHYVTPEEHQQLLEKRGDLELAIKEQGQIIGEVTTQSSETWHDNAGFDEAKRVLGVLSIQYQQIQNTILHAKVVTTEALKHGNEIAQFGSKVTVEISNNQKTFTIGGIGGDGKISYQSPLGAALINQKVGDIVTFQVQGKKISAVIISIE